MQTRTYQLIGTASQANAASVTIVAPGYIHGVCWAAYMDSTTDNATLLAELSFQAASQMATNQALGVIDAIAEYLNVGAAGAYVTGLNKVCMGMYIPVGIGQIIYLNTSMSAGSLAKALIHVIEK